MVVGQDIESEVPLFDAVPSWYQLPSMCSELHMEAVRDNR